MSHGRCRVRVCRDCCCGTGDKHPGVDHDGLLERLTLGVRRAALVSVTSCLLACDSSNVVVVSPSQAGRKAGGQPVWLRQVLDEVSVDAIADWVLRGGPGMSLLPPTLAAHAMVPPPAAVSGGPEPGMVNQVH
ncbi:hypothetical protein BH20ACT6_BH20ACT6_13990 [soil metagenome]